MQKTINHTGRRRIELKELKIQLTDTPAGIPQFDVEFSLNKKGLPEEACIYIEAYHKNTLQRFPFGRVGRIVPPESRLLDQVDRSGPVLFRALIVDESENVGRLIAKGEALRPEGDDDEDNKASLLTVKSTPMEQVTWRIEFETGGKPQLCINSKIPNAVEQLKVNPLFQSLVLPAALRQVLIHYLWDDDEDNKESDDWLRFAEHLATTERPPDNDTLALTNWVEDVVENFSKHFELCDLLIKSMEGDENV